MKKILIAGVVVFIAVVIVVLIKSPSSTDGVLDNYDPGETITDPTGYIVTQTYIPKTNSDYTIETTRVTEPQPAIAQLKSMIESDPVNFFSQHNNSNLIKTTSVDVLTIDGVDIYVIRTVQNSYSLDMYQYFIEEDDEIIYYNIAYNSKSNYEEHLESAQDDIMEIIKDSLSSSS